MRIASAQINSVLADFKGNAEKILDFTNRASDKRCDLIVFPELALFGYWPSDLIERRSNIEAQLKWMHWLHKRIPDQIAVLVGAITLNKNPHGKLYRNSAVLLRRDKAPREFHKELLPSYDVFDEHRYFEPGRMQNNVVKIKGKKVLITICEDIWASGNAWVGTRYPKNPILMLKSTKPDLVVNLSASPYSRDKQKRRSNVARFVARTLNSPVVYTNLVGAQDEIIFDGGSFAIDRSGTEIMKSASFQEDLNIIDFKENKGGFRDSIEETELIRQALVTGIRDFVNKIGMKRVHLGLSGGIDSALVACLAADALGPSRVTAVALPEPFSSEKSLNLARELAERLGCQFLVSDICPAYEKLAETLSKDFSHSEFSLVNENLQARIRANLLMAFSNMNDSLLLNTSNKSELAVGYSTLYGDLCGGLSPIGDLLKTEVYELAEHYNFEDELIPREVISREPTAELRENQKDRDSLPDYLELDKAISKVVVECKSARTKTEKWLLKKLRESEFKRWQSPPILRVSQHAFGRGRRVPIAHKSEH